VYSLYNEWHSCHMHKSGHASTRRREPQHLSHLLTQAFLDDAERHGKGIPVAFGDARVSEPRTVAVEARMLKRAFTKLLDE
jgi:hypothetical protein